MINIDNFSKLNVLILSCGTGEGHNSAARALAENLTGMGVSCEVKDSLSFRSERSRLHVCGAYCSIIRHIPSFFGCVYKVGAAYDALRLPNPVYTYNATFAHRLYKYIEEKGFNLVICTHLFSMMTMTAVRKKFAPDLPCYGVLTDYTAIPFYKNTALDGYFVGNEKTRRQLMRKGKKYEEIHCLGIPVSKRFSVAMTKDEAKDSVSIPRDKKVVAVMSGGVGCGKILKLSKVLDEDLDNSHMICVFTGRNDKLKAKLDKRFGDNDKFKIIGFTPEISLYLKAADIAFSKPGGLSSTEIAVANVPFVHLKAIPGCETENRKHFAEFGLSIYANTIGKAIKAAHSIMSDSSIADKMIENQKEHVNPHSNDMIIEKIMNLEHPHSETARSEEPICYAVSSLIG